MLLIHAKKYCILKLRVTIIIALLSLILIGASFTFFQESAKGRKKTHKEVAEMKQKLDSVQQKISKSTQSLDLWQKLGASLKNTRSGLQIQKLDEMLQKMAKKHRIIDLSIVFSKPIIKKSTQSNNFATIEEARMSLSFGAYLDTDIFQFLSNAQNKISSITHIKSLEIDAARITKDTIGNLESHKVKKLIDAKAEIIIHTIKDVAKKQDTEQNIEDR